MFFRIARREDFDQIQSVLGLHCLSRPFWQATSVRNFGTLPCALLTLKAPITTSADHKFCDISIFDKNKGRYFVRIVCQQTILMKAATTVFFGKKRQNLKLSSAANHRWRFKPADDSHEIACLIGYF